ncbi:MAG TPA: OmpA family protein [Azospirillum sp.]
MNRGIRQAWAVLPAALIVGGLMAGTAQAQTAATTDVWCNAVIGWGNTPLRTASGGYVIHNGSFPCPAQTTAAPAPAAPGLQNEYLVFFDWNKSNITPAADRIIGDVVSALGANRSTARVQVIGHTDTSGAPNYNQRLSMRRAASVKQVLVAKGVPAANVTTEGRGETQLLVRTGDNVREPSNRRAQILPRVAGPTS